MLRRDISAKSMAIAIDAAGGPPSRAYTITAVAPAPTVQIGRAHV